MSEENNQKTKKREKEDFESTTELPTSEEVTQSSPLQSEEFDVEGIPIKSESDFQTRIQKLKDSLSLLEKRRELNIITKENYDKYVNYVQQQIILSNYKYQQFLQTQNSQDFRERTEEIKNWILTVDQNGYMEIIERFFERNNYKFLSISQDLYQKGYRVADYTQEKVKVQQVLGNRIFILGLHYFNKMVEPETFQEFFETADRFGVDYGYIITSSDFSKQSKVAFKINQSIKAEYWNLDDFMSRYYMSFYREEL